MDVPETKFAAVGDDRIAYQVIGDGPRDILYTSGSGSHIDVSLEYPRFQYMIRRLASFGRVIRFDRRGVGASDPPSPDSLPSWERWLDDFNAVLDAVQSDRATIVAALDAAFAALLFAATYPSRVARLVLSNTSARFRVDDDYPAGLSDEAVERMVEATIHGWGTDAFAALAVPSLAEDPAFCRWYGKLMRASSSPRTVASNMREMLHLDVRRVLPSIKTPTLVMHSRENQLLPRAQGRYLADNLEEASFIELPGADTVMFG